MPMCAFGRAPMENVMAKVEVRDHAMWIKHIHGDVALADRLLAMSAGSLIALNVDGVSGHWRKMDDGKDGRATRSRTLACNSGSARLAGRPR
jgi:hypothetical protein